MCNIENENAGAMINKTQHPQSELGNLKSTEIKSSNLINKTTHLTKEKYIREKNDTRKRVMV